EALEAEEKRAVVLGHGGEGVAEDAALADAAEHADEGACAEREPEGVDVACGSVALPLARDPTERVEVAPRRGGQPGRPDQHAEGGDARRHGAEAMVEVWHRSGRPATSERTP